MLLAREGFVQFAKRHYSGRGIGGLPSDALYLGAFCLLIPVTFLSHDEQAHHDQAFIRLSESED